MTSAHTPLSDIHFIEWQLAGQLRSHSDKLVYPLYLGGSIPFNYLLLDYSFTSSCYSSLILFFLFSYILCGSIPFNYFLLNCSFTCSYYSFLWKNKNSYFQEKIKNHFLVSLFHILLYCAILVFISSLGKIKTPIFRRKSKTHFLFLYSISSCIVLYYNAIHFSNLLSTSATFKNSQLSLILLSPYNFIIHMFSTFIASKHSQLSLLQLTSSTFVSNIFSTFSSFIFCY